MEESTSLENVYNFDKICRLCLKEDEEMKSIFDCQESNEQIALNEIIMACAQVQVQQNDGMPNKVCKSCKYQVQRSYTFKKKWEQNDFILRSYIDKRRPRKFKRDLANNEEYQQDDFHIPIEPEITFVEHDNSTNDFFEVETDQYENDVNNKKNKIKREYSCHVCDEYFKDTKDLHLHMLKHSEHNIIDCNLCSTMNFSNEICHFCDKVFVDGNQLKQHLLTHKSKNSKRGRPSLRDRELKKQLEEINDEKDQKDEMKIEYEDYSPETKTALCKICDISFSKVIDLKNHLEKHRKIDSFAEIDLTKKPFLFDQSKIIPSMETNDVLIDHIIIELTNGNSAKFYQITNSKGQEYDFSDTDSDDEIKLENVDRREHVCYACNKSFDRLYKIMHHMKTDHTESEFLTKCMQCHKIFPNESILLRHIKAQCGNKEKIYVCRYCKIKFMWETSFEKHFKTCHSSTKQTPTKAKRERSQIGKERPKEKCFPCSICSKSFYRQEHLDRHVKIHIPSEKKFECTICQKKFNRKDNLRSHLRVHKEEKEDCDKHLCVYCGRSFSNSSNLIVHMRRHTGEKPYKCDLCDKGFPRSSDLQCHRRTHTGEKPCLCTICGKGFSRSNKLVRHMRIHTGVRPYKCTYCDRAFTQSNDLTLHIRRHTGDKPYVCGICGDRFIQGTALQAHRRMQGHFEEVNQPVPFASISVNNPNRHTNANRVNRIGLTTASQPVAAINSIPVTSTPIKIEKPMNNHENTSEIIDHSELISQSSASDTIPRIANSSNSAVTKLQPISNSSPTYGSNVQLYSNFEVTSILSISHYQQHMQQQQQQQQQQGYN